MASKLELIKFLNPNWGQECTGDCTAEWNMYFENGCHIKLEQADLTNDFSWVKQNIDKCEYYFINHVKVTNSIFQWENWRAWYFQFLCGDFD